MAFAKEIEDFLNGYSTVSKIGQDQQTSKIQKEKWDLEKEGLIQQQMEALATDPTAIPGTARTKKVRAKKVTTAPAEEGVDISLDDDGDPAASDTNPSNYSELFANGGLVEAIPSFATGGMVAAKGPNGAGLFAGFDRRNRGRRPTIGDWLQQQAEPEGAVPEQTGAAPPAETSSNDPLRQAQIDQGHTPSTGKAVKAAVDSFMQDQRQQAVGGATPEVDLLTGNGAASVQEIQAIDKTIDPNGEMDAIQRGRARLNEAYNYWMSRGFPEKAANVAKRILLFNKNQSMARGTMAGHMLQNGNIAEAAQVLQDTYNENMQDGRTMQHQVNADGTVSYQFIDDDGDVVEQGTADANQLTTMAAQTANGSTFTETTVEAADNETKRETGQATDQPAATPAPAVPETPAVPAPSAPASTQPAADEAEPAAQAATETSASETAETAVPEGKPEPTTTVKEPAKGGGKGRTVHVGMNEALTKYDQYAGVLAALDARRGEDGKLTDEDRALYNRTKKLMDKYGAAAMDMSTDGVAKGYQRKAQEEMFNWLKKSRDEATPMPDADLRELQDQAASAKAMADAVKAHGGKLAAPPAQDLADAKEAIAGGADAKEVAAEMLKNGWDPSALEE